MKIHKAEALFSNLCEPCNIGEYSFEVLKAVFLKRLEQNGDFRFKISQTGTFIINKKLFLSLILTLCKTTKKIEIGLAEERVFIKARQVQITDIQKYLKGINAKCFYEIKSGNALIILTLTKTQKMPTQNEKDWEYILNPLSVVNIYLS